MMWRINVKRVAIVFFLTMVVSICIAVKSQAAPFVNFADAMQAAIDDFSAQNYADAHADLKEALILAKSDEDKARVATLSGLTYALEKKFMEARQQFAQVLQMKNLDLSLKVEAQLNIGDTYISEKNFEKAREELIKVLGHKEDGSPLENKPIFGEADRLSKYRAELTIGQSYLTEGKYSDARRSMSNLVKYKDIIPYAELMSQFNIAQGYFYEKQFEMARVEFNKVVEVDSQKFLNENKAVALSLISAAQIGVARCYLEQKNYDRAKEEFNKALTLNKNPPVRVEIEKQLKLIEELAGQEKNPEKK